MPSQRTILANKLLADMYFQKPFVAEPNSTLNQKLTILADAIVPPGSYPHLGYFVIGNDGHEQVVGANGIRKTIAIPHKGSDFSTFRLIPLVMRETNNDLTALQRSHYRLRKQVTHEGTDYFAYYAKVLDLSTVSPIMNRLVTVNGVTTVNQFVPSNENLNPEKPALINDGVNPMEGTYLTVDTVVSIDFTEFDREEFCRVAEILYGDRKWAVISELALCSGMDRINTGPGMGGSLLEYTDAIAVQINHHITINKDLEEDTEGFLLKCNVGSGDPELVEIDD